MLVQRTAIADAKLDAAWQKLTKKNKHANEKIKQRSKVSNDMAHSTLSVAAASATAAATSA